MKRIKNLKKDKYYNGIKKLCDQNLKQSGIIWCERCYFFHCLSYDTLDKRLLINGGIMLKMFLSGSTEWSQVHGARSTKLRGHSMFFGIARYTVSVSVRAVGRSSIVRYYSIGETELWGLKTIDGCYGN